MGEKKLFQEQLKESQPVAYQTLKNGLQNNKLSHAYIFAGPKGTKKKETAYLLAQSLICEHRDPFACEECDVCRRVKDNNYADMIFFDGNQSSIKSENIEYILEQFKKTGLEAFNRKIYIMDGADHMTEAAQNKLLKFIEEPSASVTAILITEQKERILPTILSRCQTIEFKPLSPHEVNAALTEEEFDPLDAYLLSYIYKEVEVAREKLNSNEYSDARELFKEFVEDLIQDKNLALIHLENDPVIKKKKNKATFKCFVDILTLFFSDVVKGKKTNIDWYDTKLDLFQKTNYNNPRIIGVCNEAQNRLLPESRENATLVLEQLVYRL